MSISNIKGEINTGNLVSSNMSENPTIAFHPFKLLKQPGRARNGVLLWLLLCVLIIPAGVLTRFLEWTGIELMLGGVSFYITIYLPMLFCIPIVVWYGYLWAAIPAYLSTFLVSYYGGMPVEWIVVFSFANPITLALYSMLYRVTRLAADMRRVFSIVGFVTISFIAALAGSVGAFIWAHANQVGLNDAQPVWQGWWVGGWLQAVFIVLPAMHLLGPYAQQWLAPLKKLNVEKPLSYRMLALATVSFVLVLVGFVTAVRMISISQLEEINLVVTNDASLLGIQNAIDGLSYPLYILLTVMGALTYLIYRAVVFWHQTLLDVNEQLVEQNVALEQLATTDPLTGLSNRRKVLEFATSEFHRCTRNNHNLGVLMVDIDYFKRVNDDLGHLVGDAVIHSVAQRIAEGIRPYDLAGRYGGEEFIVVLPEANMRSTIDVAERVRNLVINESISTDTQPIDITVSIGLTIVKPEDKSISVTIDRADQGLLVAKKEGRNCVKFVD